MMDPRLRQIALECKGFLAEEEGLRLYALAREAAGIGPVLEIGSYCGKSSVYLAAGCREAGGRLVCVDHHRGSEEQQPGWEYHDPEVVDPQTGLIDTLPFLRHTLWRAGLEETAILVVGRSRDVAALWHAPLGMLFIDGGHSEAEAHGDFEAWAPKIAAGGILAIHDLFPDPAQGGQAPIQVYRRALATGCYEELPTTLTLGVLRRKPD